MLQKGLFLDRDGVINIDTNYVATREAFVFLPGLFPFLRAAGDKGYRLALVTNQSGVGRGMFSQADFEDLTQWMQAQLAAEGIVLSLVLASFHHPEAGQGAWLRGSYWRKPNPGMILEAAQRLGVDPARSAMLGDRLGDMQAALAAGVARPLWLTDAPEMALDGVTVVRDFNQALAYL